MTKVSAISIGKHAQLLKKTGIAGSAITATVAVITGIAIVAGNTSKKKNEAQSQRRYDAENEWNPLPGL